MAGYIVAYSSAIRTPTGYVQSTADASFPAANIGNRYPYRPWKSSVNVVSGTTYVGVDFGSAVACAAVFIDTINITSVKIQAAADTGFTTSLLDSGAITITKNRVSNRYKLFYLTSTGAIGANTRRYWRVLANTSTLFDGSAGKMSVGSICWISSIVTWQAGSSSYDELALEATVPNDQFAGGGSEPVVLGNPYAAITLDAVPASRAAMRDDVLTLLGEGIGRFFVFYKNAGDLSDAYRVRRMADVTLRQTSPLGMELRSLILEESV